MNFAGLLVDSYLTGRGAALRIGNHWRSLQGHPSGRALHLRPGSTGMSIRLSKLYFPCLFDRIPVAGGCKRGQELSCRTGLRRGAFDLPAHVDAIVAEKALQTAVLRELRGKSLGVQPDR